MANAASVQPRGDIAKCPRCGSMSYRIPRLFQNKLLVGSKRFRCENCHAIYVRWMGFSALGVELAILRLIPTFDRDKSERAVTGQPRKGLPKTEDSSVGQLASSQARNQTTEAEEPKSEPPKVEPLNVQESQADPATPEPLKFEATKFEAPMFEPPEPEPPKFEPAKSEAPKVEHYQVERVRFDPPAIEVPKVEKPIFESPKVELPKVDPPKPKPPQYEPPTIAPAPTAHKPAPVPSVAPAPISPAIGLPLHNDVAKPSQNYSAPVAPAPDSKKSPYSWQDLSWIKKSIRLPDLRWIKDSVRLPDLSWVRRSLQWPDVGWLRDSFRWPDFGRLKIQVNWAGMIRIKSSSQTAGDAPAWLKNLAIYGLIGVGIAAVIAGLYLLWFVLLPYLLSGDRSIRF